MSSKIDIRWNVSARASEGVCCRKGEFSANRVC